MFLCSLLGEGLGLVPALYLFMLKFSTSTLGCGSLNEMEVETFNSTFSSSHLQNFLLISFVKVYFRLCICFRPV